MEEYKEKRRKIIHKRIIKEEWMSMECGNMELLRKHHECRKFYKKIDMARKKFKPRVNICKNGDGSLTSNKEEIFDKWVRHFDKLLNGSKYNECVTFTTISSNQILMGKTQDNRCPHY